MNTTQIPPAPCHICGRFHRDPRKHQWLIDPKSISRAKLRFTPDAPNITVIIFDCAATHFEIAQDDGPTFSDGITVGQWISKHYGVLLLNLLPPNPPPLPHTDPA